MSGGEPTTTHDSGSWVSHLIRVAKRVSPAASMADLAEAAQSVPGVTWATAGPSGPADVRVLIQGEPEDWDELHDTIGAAIPLEIGFEVVRWEEQGLRSALQDIEDASLDRLEAGPLEAIAAIRDGAPVWEGIF